MHIDEISKKQYEHMKKDIIQDSYLWEDTFLKKELQGYLYEEREIYNHNENLSEEEIEKNNKIKEINVLINKYNQTFQNKKEIKDALEKLYNELECEEWRFNKNINFEQLNFGKKILITGPGGIGKSQYMYELYNSSKDINYRCYFLYGKYSDDLKEEDFIKIKKEIKDMAKTQNVLLGIDAINEFEISKRECIYDLLSENIDNVRIIITYRDFSMEISESEKMIGLVNEQIPFSGVDTVDSIQKMSEEFNIDLTKYEELLYDNNPLHLKMIKSEISNNRLEIIRNNSIAIGTDIYEQYIKNTTAKYNVDKSKYWKETKKLVEEFVSNNIAFPKVKDILDILKEEASDYIEVMKREGFIDVQNDIVIFRNETLKSYLIAREILKRLPESEREIEEYLIEKEKIFYFIQEQLIILLFDKISDMNKVYRIIKNTNLNKYFSDINLLNRIKFSKEKRKAFIKIFKYTGSDERALFSAGGFENNPLNCTNYLNKKLIKTNTNFNIKCSDLDIRYAKSHLISWIRTIATFQCNTEYLKEKFWFAIWCMSLVNKDVRYLSRKLIFEVIQKDEKYIDELKKIYFQIDDEYIREGIIHILCSQNKNNRKIKIFINKINDENLLNLRSLYFISNYLYSEEKYIFFNKIDILKQKNCKYKNKNVYDFYKSVLFIDKYEYNLFGMEPYGDKIKYRTKFIKEEKNKIIDINKYINRYWKCKKYCWYQEIFKRDVLFTKFGEINEKLVSDLEIYFAWQNIFKQELKKYNVKFTELNKFKAYSENDKNIVYKALEIANNKTAGSIACNYFTNEFILEDWDKNGYGEYRFEEHSDIINLNSPITIYSQDIEILNNKVLKQIKLPEKFDIEWAIDKELSINNFKNIINPIKYKGENWIMIYGSVQINYREKNNLKWSDEYIVNLSIDENYTLCKKSTKDRKYTIETNRFKDNIGDYYRKNYTQSCSLEKSFFWNDFFVESDFNLPPTKIIKEFNLTYNNLLSAWVDSNNKEVIKVSNNKDSWYQYGVTGSIFINKTYYDILKDKYDLKYFAFTERFLEHYREESSLEIEYKEGGNIEYYMHYTEGQKEEMEESCKNCKIYIKGKANEKRASIYKVENFLENIIKDYKCSEEEL